MTRGPAHAPGGGSVTAEATGRSVCGAPPIWPQIAWGEATSHSPPPTHPDPDQPGRGSAGVRWTRAWTPAVWTAGEPQHPRGTASPFSWGALCHLCLRQQPLPHRRLALWPTRRCSKGLLSVCLGAAVPHGKLLRHLARFLPSVSFPVFEYLCTLPEKTFLFKNMNV